MASESSSRSRPPASVVLAVLIAGANAGCVTQSPTISHVHIGHAITAHASTPGKVGFLVHAENQAEQADALVEGLGDTDDLASLRGELEVLQTLLYGGDLTFPDAVTEASNHITFAARSDDATANVRAGAADFEQAIQGVLVRSVLIEEYIREARETRSAAEAQQLAAEIRTLVEANLAGEDRNGNGIIGDVVEEYGVRQLRRDVDAMVAAEDPPYTTVDQWYLFNLIRLPNGDWAFGRRDSQSGRTY